MEAGGRGVGEVLGWGGAMLEEAGGDKGEVNGAESTPRLSTSIPSLITTVPPPSNACSKLISMREVRLILPLPLRSPRDAVG
jgi:hypothetical protein